MLLAERAKPMLCFGVAFLWMINYIFTKTKITDDDEERVDFECHKEEKRARSIPIILSYAQHYLTH